MTFHVKPELLNIIREDLPDELVPIVDEVTTKTEALADELFEQFSKDLNSKLLAFDVENEALQKQMSSDMEQWQKANEVAMDQMISELAKLNGQIEQLQSQQSTLEQSSGLNLNMQNLKETSNALAGTIAEQRERFRNIGQITGKVAGALGRKLVGLV